MADILVIDDDELLVEAVTQVLADMGHAVRAALDGAAGLARAEELKPGLIILDMHMPVMDGLQVARRLRLDPATRAVPIIALTGLDHEIMYDHAAAIDAYVSKPLDARILAARVKEFVAH